jgi:hypothetical protein
MADVVFYLYYTKTITLNVSIVRDLLHSQLCRLYVTLKSCSVVKSHTCVYQYTHHTRVGKGENDVWPTYLVDGAGGVCST